MAHALVREDIGLIHPLAYGATRNHLTLLAALADADNAGKGLLLSAGAWTIGENLTIGADHPVHRPHGTTLTIPPGVTVSIHTLIDDGLEGHFGAPEDPVSWVSGGGTLIIHSRMGLVDALIVPSTYEGLPPPGRLGRLRRVTNFIRGLFLDLGSAWVSLRDWTWRPELFPGADLAAKISAIMAVMPASGGVIDARGYIGYHQSAAPIVLSKPCTLLLGQGTYACTGAGPVLRVTAPQSVTIAGAGRTSTHLLALEATEPIIRVESDEEVRLHDFSLDTAVPRDPAAAGLYVTGGPIAGMQRGLIVERVWVVEQAIGFDLHDVVGIIIRDCYFVQTTAIGILLANYTEPDAGDGLISGCAFHSVQPEPTVGILQISSGGLKIQGCKFLDHTIGYALNIGDGHHTSILELVNNSFESQHFACVNIGNSAGTGSFGAIILNGNHFSATTFPTEFLLLIGAPNITDVHICDNLLAVQGAKTGVSLTQLVRASLEDNRILGHGSGGIGVLIQPSCAHVRVGQNDFKISQTIVDLGGTQTVIEPHIHIGTAVVDPPPLAAGGINAVNVTVPGLEPGDAIHFNLAPGFGNQVLYGGAYVDAPHTAVLLFYNTTNAPVNLGPSTWTYTWVDRLQRF